MAFIATVRILIDPETSGVTTPAEACDWISGLLSENPQVKDWAYLPSADAEAGYETPRLYIMPDEYHEGDAFE